MEFSYKLVGPHLYPMVPLTVCSGSNSIETHALLDSGSRFSLFQVHIAQQLGFNYKSDKPAQVITFDEKNKRVTLEDY